MNSKLQCFIVFFSIKLEFLMVVWEQDLKSVMVGNDFLKYQTVVSRGYASLNSSGGLVH